MIHRYRARKRPTWRRPDVSLPDVDIAEARAEAERRLQNARPALDLAHGEFVDRLVADLADRWRNDAYLAYTDRLGELAELRRDALAVRTRLTDQVTKLGLDLARHLSVRDSAWTALCGSDVDPHGAAVPKTPVSELLTAAVKVPASGHRPATAPSNHRPAADVVASALPDHERNQP